MNVPGVTDAALLGALSSFFDGTCTIKENTGTTRSATGKPVENWTNLAAHVDLPCRVAPVMALQGGRVPVADMTITTDTQIIILPGPYAAIHTGMQAVVGGVTYTVRRILRDSEQLAAELIVEAVTT